MINFQALSIFVLSAVSFASATPQFGGSPIIKSPFIELILCLGFGGHHAPVHHATMAPHTHLTWEQCHQAVSHRGNFF